MSDTIEQRTEELNGDSTSERSLREELVKNLESIKESHSDSGAPASAASTTDAADKTATTGAASTTAAPAKTETTGTAPTKTEGSTPSAQTQADATKAKAPQSWSAAERAHWDKVPPEVQAVIARREEEIHRGITALGQDAATGKKFAEVVTPYLPLIRSEGGEPIAAVRDLLQTAYVLRTGDAGQRVELFKQLAQQFRVDLSQVTADYQAPDPQLQAVHQELAQLRAHAMGEQQRQHQQFQASVRSQIATFAADPKNEFFEQVRPKMGALLTGGVAKDLQEAYDMACHADPDVRSTIQSRQQAEAEAKRAAEAKARADAKRRAGVSVTGSPGITAPKTTGTQELSLRDELRAQLRAAQS